MEYKRDYSNQISCKNRSVSDDPMSRDWCIARNDWCNYDPVCRKPIEEYSMRACGNRVIVALPNANEIETPGGIVLTGSQKGIVSGVAISVGPGRTEQELPPCEEGDTVYFNYSSSFLVIEKDEDIDNIVLDFSQIIAVDND